MKCMVWCICVINVHDIWMRCMRMWANLLHCLLDLENKSMSAAEDYKSLCCEVWSADEFAFREMNFVVRKMPCTVWKIGLGNLKKLDDFYRRLIIGSFVPLGIKLHVVGNFMENNLERFPYLLKPSAIVFYFVYL